MRMRTFRVRLRPAVLALTAVVTALVAATTAASSQAGSSALFCPTSSGISMPFYPWGDPSWYVLAPDGGLEGGGAGWTLNSGAAVRLGNEPYRVHGAWDSRMLDLPAGASATTPALCIDASLPTMRFFVSGLWSGGSRLTVEALYVDSYGVEAWRKISSITTMSGWEPSKVFRLPDKIQSPSVRFRFSVSGGFGGYRLDDLYVDPYIRV